MQLIQLGTIEVSCSFSCVIDTRMKGWVYLINKSHLALCHPFSTNRLATDMHCPKKTFHATFSNTSIAR